MPLVEQLMARAVMGSLQQKYKWRNTNFWQKYKKLLLQQKNTIYF
jgi:hypothetical protein